MNCLVCHALLPQHLLPANDRMPNICSGCMRYTSLPVRPPTPRPPSGIGHGQALRGTQETVTVPAYSGFSGRGMGKVYRITGNEAVGMGRGYSRRPSFNPGAGNNNPKEAAIDKENKEEEKKKK